MTSYLHDLWAFVVAISNQWATLLTGGIITAAVTFYYSVIKKASQPHKVSKILAILFAVLACFNAWRIEYLKTHPDLQLHVDQFGFAAGVQKAPGVPLLDTKGIPAIVSATLRNLGPAATIADTWVLTVKLPGQKEVLTPRLMDFDLPNKPPITMDGETIPMDKLLYRETRAPVAPGDKREGILAFFLDGKTLADVRPGTKITLSCRDIAGNLIKSEVVWNGGGGKFQHSPGLEP